MKHSPTKPHGWARPFIKQLLWSVTFINSRRFLRMNVQAKQKIVDFVMINSEWEYYEGKELDDFYYFVYMFIPFTNGLLI